MESKTSKASKAQSQAQPQAQLTQLIVVEAFGDYRRGDAIKELAEMERIKTSIAKNHYHEIPLNSEE